jgi:tetratricopeptide (TPR) repeat protein
MKKLTFIMLFIGMATFTFGQYVPKGKTTKAELALTKGELDIAKAEIDEAFKIDAKGKVSGAAKNWYTKGKIYKAIYLDDSTDYKNLAGKEALGVAMEAFNKVTSMEKENSPYVIMANTEISQLYGSIINDGAEKYNENDFEGAYHDFMTALEVEEGDTTALLYGGVSAQQADMVDEALACFQTLADNGDAKIDTYKTMIYLYRTEKEDMEGVLRIVTQALEVYPENSELAQEKITTLIMMERVDEAKNYL